MKEEFTVHQHMSYSAEDLMKEITYYVPSGPEYLNEETIEYKVTITVEEQ